MGIGRGHVVHRQMIGLHGVAIKMHDGRRQHCLSQRPHSQGPDAVLGQMGFGAEKALRLGCVHTVLELGFDFAFG